MAIEHTTNIRTLSARCPVEILPPVFGEAAPDRWETGGYGGRPNKVLTAAMEFCVLDTVQYLPNRYSLYQPAIEGFGNAAERAVRMCLQILAMTWSNGEEEI